MDTIWTLGTILTRGEAAPAPKFVENRDVLKKFLAVEEE
jgi:hypothetical protein